MARERLGATIQTLSLLAGSEACNARCPFCVSKMTPEHGLGIKEPEISWERLRQALEYARIGNTDTMMITGKGEPTLFPEHVTRLLTAVTEYEKETGFRFKKKELQSNGIYIENKPEKYEPFLKKWADLGLNTYIISIVHYDPEINRQIYVPYSSSYIDLASLTNRLHQNNLRVRLSCIMFNGGIDNREKFANLINFTHRIGADELTARPVTKPDISRNQDVTGWITEHQLTDGEFQDISTFLDEVGLVRQRYPFGGIIASVEGQNVCLTNCLTRNQDDYIRQLIFHASGDIATEWTEDAILLP